MAQATVTLSYEEIEALLISITENKIKLENSIEHLECHNKTGVNAKLISKKKDRIIDLDNLFTKLCSAQIETR